MNNKPSNEEVLECIEKHKSAFKEGAFMKLVKLKGEVYWLRKSETHWHSHMAKTGLFYDPKSEEIEE